MKSNLLFIFLIGLFAKIEAQQLNDYHVVWESQSKHSGESMPCGGGDIGLNVWVENGDLLFYISRSGTFDENNTLLKLGRARIKISPNPFENGTFRQELNLKDGCIQIKGKNDKLTSDILVWVDVKNPAIHVDIENNKDAKIEVFYENWRYKDRLIRKNEAHQSAYKWSLPEGFKTLKDDISFHENEIVFYHKNASSTVFDETVEDQELSHIKDQLFNPLKNLISGGKLYAPGFKQAGIQEGIYADTDYKAWKLINEKSGRSSRLDIILHTEQTNDASLWEKHLQQTASTVQKNRKKNRDVTVLWWHNLWNRSFVMMNSADGKAFEIGRNYQLFRYMLACNAYGAYPTKFNGGLFTYDSKHVKEDYPFTPDFRNWGGGTHTAQNQRLVYFPMIKNGDFDMLKSQFDFYFRILKTAELRSKVYWGHEGACFTEQMDQFGLPNIQENKFPGTKISSYKGVEANPWLEYEWDTVLEFCLMMLDEERFTGKDISEYIPFIESCVIFFDKHYQHLASERGTHILDGDNKLVLYPGSGCETYKMATNATSTIAALKTIINRLLELDERYLNHIKRQSFSELLRRIPDIKTRVCNNHETIAPAWSWERIFNQECPQLYPVFPWGIYGLGKPGLDIAINTWNHDPDVIKNRNYIGWKQEPIWAARLGLKEEAKELIIQKMQNASTRFPVFWGPGFDWTPDHNWGGSGMIAIQEMLMQCDGKKILLLPSWPKEWDVHFKLHAPYQTTVECRLKNGKIESLKVAPEERMKDIETLLK